LFILPLNHQQPWFIAMNKLAIFAIILFIAGCSSEKKPGLQFAPKGNEVPAFNADSAYTFVEQQVSFGPRNPNTFGHVEVQSFLKNKLGEYAGDEFVFFQRFTHPGYGNDTLRLANIIASFNPYASDRIMLAAHYDTRPRADEDTTNVNNAIPGADDGGSGVAVLLELARIFKNNPPPVGVDIVLFDGEDYGTSGDLPNYFLGSRYWADNPPVQGYNPRFGILLDMVGGNNAFFPKEVNSLQYAPNLVNEVWAIAKEKGYGWLFSEEEGGRVQDDHVIVSEYTNIPMINIINHRRGVNGSVVFADYWHTHRDNMNIISRETLEAVGVVLSELIYNRL